MSRLPGDRDNFHSAVGHLRHLQPEQALDQLRVGSRQGHRGAVRPADDAHDIALDAIAVFEPLTGNLLGRREYPFDGAEVHQHDLGAGPLLMVLDNPGDHLVLTIRILPIGDLLLGLAQSLHDDLLGRHRRDPAEIGRRVLPLPRHAVRGGLTGVDSDVPRGPVDDHTRIVRRAVGVPVGRQQRGLDRGHQSVEGDVPLALDPTQCRHVELHRSASASSSSSIARNSTCTAARTTSAKDIRTASPPAVRRPSTASSTKSGPLVCTRPRI